MVFLLYDIPSSVPGKAFSPNTFKARISLNFKGIAYQTVWVEYPDIEETCKKLGAPATSKKSDGQDHYTLPILVDTSNGKAISDSHAIAMYLDEAFPDTPKLFPMGKEATIESFLDLIWSAIVIPSLPITVPASNYILSPRSEEYYRRTREALFGKKLQEFSPPGEKRRKDWGVVKEGWTKVANQMDALGGNQRYACGDEFTFADTLLIGCIQWFRLVLKPEEWEEVITWNDGRWAKILEESKELVLVSK